jgi:hypothetical protein
VNRVIRKKRSATTRNVTRLNRSWDFAHRQIWPVSSYHTQRPYLISHSFVETLVHVRFPHLNLFRLQRTLLVVYTLAKELYPGKYRPTLTHSFIKLLSDKGLLSQCFTQNIDTLERRAGIPAGKIIEAHGSFATQRCIECKRSFSDTEMKECVKEERIPRCETCKGLVKPDIVFFGESVSLLIQTLLRQTSFIRSLCSFLRVSLAP